MNKNRLYLILLLVFSVVFTSHAQDEAAFSEDIAAEFQSILDAQSASIGVLLRIESADGVFSSATGYSKLEDEIPMQATDSFRIGSITKMVTAALALRLAEEGLLSLDDKLADWLPEIAAELPNGEQITLRHLLSHSSGLFEPFESTLFTIRILGGYFEHQWTAEAYAEEILPLLGGAYFAPAEGWHYSNANYHFMGMVLEKAAERPIQELYQDYIYEPLGLEQSYLANFDEPLGNLVDGYNALQNPRNVSTWNASVAWAAGGLVSTTEEVAIFTRAVLTGAFFKDENSLNEMLTTVPIAEGYSYGLGVFMTPDGFIGHNGGTPGFNALTYYNPETETIIVIGQNTETADYTPLLESLVSKLTELGL